MAIVVHNNMSVVPLLLQSLLVSQKVPRSFLQWTMLLSHLSQLCVLQCLTYVAFVTAPLIPQHMFQYLVLIKVNHSPSAGTLAFDFSILTTLLLPLQLNLIKTVSHYYLQKDPMVVSRAVALEFQVPGCSSSIGSET